jgi:hypothetical protein
VAQPNAPVRRYTLPPWVRRSGKSSTKNKASQCLLQGLPFTVRLLLSAFVGTARRFHLTFASHHPRICGLAARLPRNSHAWILRLATEPLRTAPPLSSGIPVGLLAPCRKLYTVSPQSRASITSSPNPFTSPRALVQRPAEWLQASTPSS